METSEKRDGKRLLAWAIAATAIIWPMLGCGEDDVDDTGGGPDAGGDTDADACTAGIWDDDASVQGPLGLDELRGYTGITGNLRLGYDGGPTDVYAFPDGLSALSCLTFVGGDLEIFMTDLSSLAGLDNLESVGGDVWIGDRPVPEDSPELFFGNPELASLQGLGALASVGGSLFLRYNPALADVDGLSGLTSVEVFLVIEANDALTDVDGLGGLTALGEELNIWGNAALTDIDGLSGLSSLGGGNENIAIDSNDSLTNLDGLANFTSLTGCLNVLRNDALTSLEGLSGFTSMACLNINGNDALTSVDGLDALASVGNLNIGDWGPEFESEGGNAALTNLDGLSALSSASYVAVRGNLALPQCEVCELLSQLDELTVDFESYGNLADSCTDDCD